MRLLFALGLNGLQAITTVDIDEEDNKTLQVLIEIRCLWMMQREPNKMIEQMPIAEGLWMDQPLSN